MYTCVTLRHETVVSIYMYSESSGSKSLTYRGSPFNTPCRNEPTS